MINKLRIPLFLLLSILFIIMPIVNATSSTLDSQAEQTLNNFFECINSGSSNVYNYIDKSNTELYNNIENQLHSLSIKYEITDVIKENDKYTVKFRFSAEGINWNVSGFTANLVLQKEGNNYKIVDTDFFEIIKPENILKFTFKIFLIIGLIGIIAAIILIVVIILVFKKINKKNTNNEIINNNNSNI